MWLFMNAAVRSDMLGNWPVWQLSGSRTFGPLRDYSGNPWTFPKAQSLLNVDVDKIDCHIICIGLRSPILCYNMNGCVAKFTFFSHMS